MTHEVMSGKGQKTDLCILKKCTGKANQDLPHLEATSEDGTRIISAVANVAWLHCLDGLSRAAQRNAFKKPVFRNVHYCAGHCNMLYTSFITTVMEFTGLSLPYPSLSEPPNRQHGREQCPSRSWTKGSSSQWSLVRPLPLFLRDLPVFKNGVMSLASFVVSSAPSPELMVASTRT